jgi:hypothetical protein
MRYNFLSNGGACITVPSPSVTPEMVLEAAILNVGEEIVRSRLRIMSYTPSTGHPSIVDISGGSLEESLKIQENVAAEVKKNNLPVLWIMSIDTYETFAFKDKALIANYIVQGTAKLRQSDDVMLVFGKPSTSSIQLLSDNCDVHLRLEEVNGALILYAVRPPTSAYGVTYEFASGYPQVHLTRMM